MLNDNFHPLPSFPNCYAHSAYTSKVLKRKESHNIGKYGFFFQRENDSSLFDLTHLPANLRLSSGAEGIKIQSGKSSSSL